MKRILFIVLLLAITPIVGKAQDDDCTFDTLEEGSLMFEHEENDTNAFFMIFGNHTALRNRCVMDITNRTSSSKPSRYEFYMKVQSYRKASIYVNRGTDEDNYVPDTEALFGTIELHNNCMYLYDIEGKFMMKLERKY